MNKEYWDAACAYFGFDIDKSNKEYADIVAAYSTANRSYHNQEHLYNMLEILNGIQRDSDACALSAKQLFCLVLAIFFHDLHYDVRANNNENLSGLEAFRFCYDCGNTGIGDLVDTCIVFGTTHPVKKNVNLTINLLHDLDLSGFVAPYQSVVEDCRKIRREYNFVPEPLFREKRAEILATFASDEIFFTEPFKPFERLARMNMTRVASDLRNNKFAL